MRRAENYHVGAVITAYQIGPVLTDTILCVLGQKDVALSSVVIVVDGCTYQKTTRSICNRITRAFGDTVRFLWLENGGVSRARNIGVRYTLDQNPDVSGVFFIDGDDLLDNVSIGRCVRSLVHAKQQNPEKRIGWTYSNQGQFGGDNPFVEYPEHFISTRWLANNLSQPCCLIDRSVFDAGVFWDESMRRGVEDWEFWLSAIKAGFTGTPSKNSYLRYRRLTGNRSSLNRSNDAITINYMRNKHSELFCPERFIKEECDYFPRWAFLQSGSDTQFRLGTDPLGELKEVSKQVFVSALSKRRFIRKSDQYIIDPYFPNMVAFLDPGDEEFLYKSKLLHSLMMQVEIFLESSVICTLSLTKEHPTLNEEQSTRIIESRNSVNDSFTSFFVSLSQLHQYTIDNTGLSNPQSIVDSVLKKRRNHLGVNGENILGELTLADSIGNSARDRFTRLVCEIQQIYELPSAVSHLQRPRHTQCAHHNANHRSLGKSLLGVWPLLPLSPGSDIKNNVCCICRDSDTGYLHGLISRFSGIEQLKGASIRVFCLGKRFDLRPLAEMPTVDAIGMTEFQEVYDNGLDYDGYMGHPKYEHRKIKEIRLIEGFLASSNLIIDLVGPEIVAPLMSCKSRGIDTVHVVKQLSNFSIEGHFQNTDKPCGTTTESRNVRGAGLSKIAVADAYFLQAYIDAYDYLIVPDNKVRTTLIGYGISSSKLVTDLAACFDNTSKENISVKEIDSTLAFEVP